MINSNRVFAVFILVILFAQPVKADEPLEILFIGSSFFNYNNLPNLFTNLAINSEKEISIDQYIPSGLYLSDHATSSTTEAKINERDWDYVILQGVGRITAYPEVYLDHSVYPALGELKNKISANCASTKMVFCMPWAYEDGMTWLDGWTDTFADMQVHIYNNTLEYSDDIDFMIAPVGWAWYAVLEEQNYPLHYLHLSDWNHPSLKGSYLMACTIFSTIYQESCIDIPYFGGLPEETAHYFQNAASVSVLDNLDLWNIPPMVVSGETIIIPENFLLFQNYPNPFNPTTTLLYDLPNESEVRLVVFDVKGREVTELINTHIQSGNHQAIWNGRNSLGKEMPTGLYFAKMMTTDYSKTIKMVLMK